MVVVRAMALLNMDGLLVAYRSAFLFVFVRADFRLASGHEQDGGRLRLDGQARDDKSQTGESHDVRIPFPHSLLFIRNALTI